MATSYAHDPARLFLQKPPGRGRIARINAALESAWSRGWLERPRLDPGAVMAAARRVAGLDDFGAEAGWRERLDLLIGALHAEAGLNALGHTIAYGQLVAALAHRLRSTALWAKYPEILHRPERAPIIIVGQMRSGSTRVQRLLACDDRLAHTRFFESWNPVPRWPSMPFDDRRIRSWLALTLAKAINPRFGIIHPGTASQVDEEIGFHNIALYGSAFEAQWRIPSFARHGETMDSRPVYTEFLRYLQTIRWLGNRGVERPWVLKLPQFAQDLDAVLSVFPDARLILLDRDPVHVVGSSASLVCNQMTVQATSVDQAWIGREWLRKTALRSVRTRNALSRFEGPRTVLTYDAMQDDWEGEMAKLYAALGLSFTERVRGRMARFLSRRRHARLDQHHYDVAEFDLRPDKIRATVGSFEREDEFRHMRRHVLRRGLRI